MSSLAIDELNVSKSNDLMMYNSTTYGKLQLICEQMKELKNKAMELIDQSMLNKRLHNYECNFVKVKGQMYHFYERDDESIFCFRWNGDYS